MKTADLSLAWGFLALDGRVRPALVCYLKTTPGAARMPPACSPLGARLDAEGEICDLSDDGGRPSATSSPGTQSLAERPLGRLHILTEARNSAQQKAVSSDHGPPLWLFCSPRDRWALLETFPVIRIGGEGWVEPMAAAKHPAMRRRAGRPSQPGVTQPSVPAVRRNPGPDQCIRDLPVHCPH